MDPTYLTIYFKLYFTKKKKLKSNTKSDKYKSDQHRKRTVAVIATMNSLATHIQWQLSKIM